MHSLGSEGETQSAAKGLHVESGVVSNDKMEMIKMKMALSGTVWNTGGTHTSAILASCFLRSGF